MKILNSTINCKVNIARGLIDEMITVSEDTVQSEIQH